MRNPVTSLLLFCAISHVASAEVVSLADQTFEHQTQASIGATTGSWLILFQAPECTSCQTLYPILDELSAHVYENEIVVATMDVKENPNTATRFEIATVPTLLYLHKGAMFRYPAAEFFSLEELTNFVLRDYQQETALPIPNPVSLIQQIVKVFLNVLEGDIHSYQKIVFAIAVMGMVLMLIATIGVLIVTLAKSSKAQKKTKSS